MPDIKKDINSTEKLLNVIRGKEKESFGAFGEQKGPLTFNKKIKNIKNIKLALPQIFSPKKKNIVGIDIGRDFICLVKTTRNSDNSYTLVDKKIIKYSPDQASTSSGFNTIFKSSIIDFCDALEDCDIWTKISTNEVNVNFFQIPRVPKKQLEKVIFWTAKKEGFIDEEKQIFDFEIQGEVVEQGTPKYSVMFYTATKTEMEGIKSVFEDIGIKLAGITIVPFAMQNIFRSKWMPSTDEMFASLFIGDNYSRIDVYNKQNLVMTRGIKTGSSSSMVEAIVSSVESKTEGLKLDQSEAKKILFSIDAESGSLSETDDRKGFKKEEILAMITPVWERLARQVDLTLSTSAIENKKVEKIYILSSVNFDQSILDYISNQLDTKAEFFDPFKNQKSAIAEDSLKSSDRMLLSPALGFALSDNSHTPNLIFTYKEKNQEINLKRINRYVFLSFMVALIICFAVLFYQGSKLSYLRNNKTVLEKELALYRPLLSEATIRQVVDKVKIQRTMAHQYVRKYLGLALIGEISDLTPQNVRLISFRSREASAAPQTNADKTQNVNADDIEIEGIIFDKKEMLESELAKYVVKLENSLIFNKVSVTKKNVVTFDKKEVIHFVLNAKQG